MSPRAFETYHGVYGRSSSRAGGIKLDFISQESRGAEGEDADAELPTCTFMSFSQIHSRACCFAETTTAASHRKRQEQALAPAGGAALLLST
jgi:hypothetical protein